jgi:hypothetical protein
MHPCAYNNPIFVDVDGGGFKANGDLLDWGYPSKLASVEEVKKKIGVESIKSATIGTAEQ